MRRELALLSEKPFDLVVVGGGVFGIFTAWDAALRGLSVAILERGDWAQAASANCFKMVHGGIRYLQHLDLPRIRQSSRERNTFLRIAPHLVRPLPILIPTYGHGRSGRGILGLAVRAYDLLTWDRSRGIQDPSLRLPRGRVLTTRETLELYPELPAAGLTGGALVHDGQMHSPARLALCALRSAVEHGACAANYVVVNAFLRRGNEVEGVLAEDRELGVDLVVRGRVVVNAAGAWAGPLLRSSLGLALKPRPSYSRDAFFVVDRRIGPDVALAVRGKMRDPDAILSRDSRHLFLVPWARQTLIGVWHRVYEGPPDDVALPMRDVQTFIDEVNWAYPAARLTLDSVCMTQHGLVLFGENEPRSTNLSYGKRSRLIDHERADGFGRLVTLLGVRYTTARAEAVRAVDLATRKLGRRVPRSRTDSVPIHGGAIGDRERFLREAERSRPPYIDDATIRRMVQNHGSAYREVLAEAEGKPEAFRPLAGLELTPAEVRHAVRMEMARTLADLIFRRTDVGSGPDPGVHAIRACALTMGQELGWDPMRIKQEAETVHAMFPSNRPEAFA